MADNPDLSSMLARLAQYSQPQPALPTPHHLVTTSDLQQPPVPQVRLATQQTKTTIDPATITSWQEGLRCVTKIAAQSRSFEASIRKMIRDQRTQELKWYGERQDLRRSQATRAKSSADAQSILNALNSGSALTADDTITTEATNAAELAKLDRKIYDAQLELEESLTAGLKSLGVPFFGTPESLILAAASETALDHLPKYSQPVTSEQLQALRRRMIAHLEDLYSD